MGKKVSDFLKSEISSSVFYLAFGLCLLLVPDQTVNIICKIVFGLVMIASGIYHIVIYTAEKEKATILDLFTGVIVMVLGIFLFFTPQIVIKNTMSATPSAVRIIPENRIIRVTLKKE